MHGHHAVAPNGQEYFVTGAAGFVGTRLVQALVERGCSVRALYHCAKPTAPPGFAWGDHNPFTSPRLNLVSGDITDRQSLRRAMAGCTHVFHVAAYARNWAADRNLFKAQNIEGVRNVCAVARELGVERIVWTSSIVTFGPTRPGEIGDEDTPRMTNRYFTEYEATKTVAEREVLAMAADGLPVVTVNPTRVYGPGHLTEGNALARLIDAYDRGRMPLLMNRGVNVGNYVFVDDVVQGHLLAMQRGRIGQRYILGGENASLKEFFHAIARVSGKRHLQIPILGISPLVFAWFLQKRAEWLGYHPSMTPGWVRTFLADWAYRCDKAQRELGYAPTPLEEGIRVTYEWLLRVRKETE
ncbi:MAG: NAD-dependent epimerase/dehydratase family protein [Patescibacteria group bacterium]|nr:NAD-dependent epimerase/dehydratase family protein [Patescibacteria group bacterium]